MPQEQSHYYSFNSFLKQRFGCKVYKLSLNGGFTCPNRDGTVGTSGCIFCSAGGSGEFSADKNESIQKQIELAKQQVSAKIKNGKYIAYFQAFTNTYGTVEYLRSIYCQAIFHEDIVALSIATRPDCLSDDVLNLLSELNKIKPIFVELGLQTIHSQTARYIRRGYELSVYDTAVKSLKGIGINTVVHIIIGLPNETRKMMLDTVRYVCQGGIDGIKLQLLHVLEGTDLATEYKNGSFSVLGMEEYIDILCECIQIIPENIVIHRLTGDGDKKLLIAPEWSGNKKVVLNSINKALSDRAIFQGSHANHNNS